MVRRKSVGGRSSVELIVPVRKPRPSGEYGTNPTPSSAAAGTTLASTSRLQIDHSLCTAAIGCTATAARSSSAVTSDNPRWRTLPRGHQLGHRADGLIDRDRWIAAMHVVEVDA